MTSQFAWIIIAVVAVIILLTVVLIMSRYKKCRSDEVLVVYGKTRGVSSAKCYHGGAAFVWPVIQGYEVMSMKPMQIQCDLRDTWSNQKVKVSVPTVVTVAISTDQAIMQNAAIRLLGMDQDQMTSTIRDIIWGQMRGIVGTLTPEDLVSDRNKFLAECIKNIEPELNKIGISLVNINISDVTDSAEYLENQGKQAAERARNEAIRQIEEQKKLGETGVAEQNKQKEIQLSEIRRDEKIQVAENQKTQSIKTAEINKEMTTVTSETEKDRDVRLSEINKEKTISVAQNEADAVKQVATLSKSRDVEVAKQEAGRDSEKAQAEQEAKAKIMEATKDSEARQAAAGFKSEAAKSQAEQSKLANIAAYESETRQKKADANRAAKITENENGIEIAKSDAALGKQQAEAEQVVGESKAQAQEAVGKAEAKKNEEVAKANAKARQEQLNASIIVDAQAEALRKKTEAEGIKAKIITEAEAEAEAMRIKAQAQAELIRLTKLAEAEGALAMAGAKKAEIGAETANITALKEAGIGDAAIVQWSMKDEYKHIMEAENKRFEHLNLGSVQVIGGSGEAGNFLLKTVDAVTKATSVGDYIPGLPGVVEALHNFDRKQLAKGNEQKPGTAVDPEPIFPDPERRPVKSDGKGHQKPSKHQEPQKSTVKPEDNGGETAE